MASRLSFVSLSLILAFIGTTAQSQVVPTGAYTPTKGACPADFQLVRMAGSAASNQTLSTGEAAYIQSRKSEVIPGAWQTYLSNVEAAASGTTLPSYVSALLANESGGPTLGIATSGGGYRAAIVGAGFLNALDGRNGTSAAAGTGGLLQGASYLSGLSGGAWFVSSLAQANFPTIQNLIFPPTEYAAPGGASDANAYWGGWHANYSFVTPSDDPLVDAAYVSWCVDEILGKQLAGYPVTFGDVWSRTLARHFANGTTGSNFYDESYPHGAGVLFSEIANTSMFESYQIPFPIVVTDIDVPTTNASAIIPGDVEPITNPIMEFNVYEMGSYDPLLSAFAPTKYLGTTNGSLCVTNYDQSSFVAASSSELFNGLTFELLNDTFGPLLAAASDSLPGLQNELYAYWPNPFYGVAPDTFGASKQSSLHLVDGGEDGENVPLQPLLVKARGVDIIVAIDVSSDENNFADGSALIATQDRVALFPSAYSFPPVPTTAAEFTSQNLTTRPTFFGCTTTPANLSTPLVVYLANGGPPHDGAAPVTNTSTYQLSYEDSEVQAMLDQTFVLATQGYPASAGETMDPEWPACLACAVVDRARERVGTARSGVCESCLERYCWS
ncbi:lysophospholipase [Coniophora puteana RWD-64-598 SS2]|uniref:Lysophospholipase n=1 Tax=Coniophora puteana (strain RWD-64-598) TaxID=741705 RepID=A0A5M3M6N5_CONPW|nr:lysophospholipase [Coniophora puteana RWD-64-598 SS2]EIW74777.1 lysophospholipase [Coniophora puteana RWD-64-598 SS2]